MKISGTQSQVKAATEIAKSMLPKWKESQIPGFQKLAELIEENGSNASFWLDIKKSGYKTYNAKILLLAEDEDFCPEDLYLYNWENN